MNSKMLLAFVGGLIVASGVTYYAMKRNPPAPADVATAPASVVPAQQPPAELPPTDAEVKPAPDAAANTSPAKPTPAPVRAERSNRTVQTVRVKPVEPLPDKPKVPPEPAAVRTEAPAPAPAPVDPQQQQARVEPAPVLAVPNDPPPPPPPAPTPATVTISRGTLLTVRLGETLSTEKNSAGDQFNAVLDQPLEVDGFVIAERGAKAQGRIVELEKSGKVKGLARMAIELTHLHTSDGQNVRINTSAFTRQAESSTKMDAAKVGIGAAIGAAIGAMAGGGKGAGIGAGAGGAAGAGGVLLTRGKPAELRVETRISFRVSEPVTLSEHLR